jgi:hypothetical protein
LKAGSRRFISFIESSVFQKKTDRLKTNINKPGGLDGLRGAWSALLILRMVITPQLTTKQSKIRTLDHALATIDHRVRYQWVKARHISSMFAERDLPVPYAI